MRRTLWLALSLVGCGAAAPQTTLVAATPDACRDADGLVVELPGPIASVWSGASLTAGHGTATLRWCGAGVLVIDRMTLGDPAGASAEYAFDASLARLERGETLARDVHGTTTLGTTPLTVYAHTDAGQALVAHAMIESVEAPDLVAARDACLAAHGTFAPAGLAQTFACDRPTEDAGRRCLSDAECEGACIDDHVEVTTTPPDGRSCAAGEEVRLHVGTCAAHTLGFGCSARLSTPTTECVVPGRASRQHTTCVD